MLSQSRNELGSVIIMRSLLIFLLIGCQWCFFALAQNSTTDEASDGAPKSRQKRYLLLWCMNFPDCCDIRGKDRCGFACPKCPIKLDMYGRRIPKTTTPAPTTPKPSKPPSPRSPKPDSSSNDVLAKAFAELGEGSAPNIQALLKIPAVQDMILSRIAEQAPGQSDAQVAALLKNPFIMSMILARVAAQAGGSSAPAVPSASTRPPTTTVRTTTKKPSGSVPSGVKEAIPGFAALAAAFPGGPAALEKLLNDPQVLGFIQNNPDVVQSIVGNGPPDPEKLQALLALASPPPEGAEQGIFGPDIFADEEFDVQGFGDYEYDDYEDEDEVVIPPGVTEAIPGFAALAAAFPGGPAALEKILNDPQVLGFIQNNPDVVQSIVGNGPPDPEKLQALLALASPPPEGAKQGIFGPDIFADEEFDVQGFDDIEYDDYADYADYGDYGNFEGNAIEEEEQRSGRSRDLNSKSNKPFKTTAAIIKTQTPKMTEKTPILRYSYRILKTVHGH